MPSFEEIALRVAGGAAVLNGASLIASPEHSLAKFVFKDEAQFSTKEVKSLVRVAGMGACAVGTAYLLSSACDDNTHKRRTVAALGAVCLGGAAMHAHMASKNVTRKEISVPAACVSAALGTALLVHGLMGERGAGGTGKA